METTIENLEGNNIKVTVEIDAADVDKRFNKVYKDFAHRYNFPGFRKGKAPRKVIDNALGAEAVAASATDALINGSYPLVIEEQKLSPAGDPVFSETMGLAEQGKPFTMVFSLDIKPQFELSSYDPVKVEIPAEGASEAEIDDQLEALREHYMTYEDANAATKFKPENFAVLNIKATDADGNDIESISSEERLYGPGTDMFSEAFDEEVLGMKKGQTKEFTLEVPEDETAVLLSDQAGKTVNFTVTCEVVKKKQVPEATDEWAKEVMGFESLADLRSAIADSIEAQKGDIIPRIKENAALTQLVDRLEGDVPEGMVEIQERQLLQDFFTQLQQQGLTFDAYLNMQGIDNEQFKNDVKAQALDEAKRELALDAWARHKGMEATDEEISAEFVKAQLPDPAATEKEWRESGRLYLIREGILRAKAAEDLLETAEVTELDVSELAEKGKKSSKKSSSKKGEKKSSKKSEEKDEEKPEE